MSTRKRVDGQNDFQREVQSHLDLETDQLIREGLTPGEARTTARRRFGNIAAALERRYETGRVLWLDALLQDLRAALRNMRRHPVASAVAILSLGAGIGATTATLTVRNAIFRSPPPLYRDPDRLSRIRMGRPERPGLTGRVPASLFLRWAGSRGSNIGAVSTSGTLHDLRTDDRTDTAAVRGVTANLFTLLGVSAHIGDARFQPPAGAAAPPAAVLSYRVWERVFDRRQDVLGRTVWIDEQPHVVVGVMPERFWLSEMSSPIWRLIDPRTLPADEPLDVFVRRSAEVSPQALEAQLLPETLAQAAHGPPDQRQIRARVRGVEGTPIGEQVSLVLPYLLGVSVLLTLVIACANAAVLMIAEWTTREHEIAIRASIGAGRARIIRSLLTESSLIAACGGAAGVGLTYGLQAWIVSRGAGGIEFFNVALDVSVLAQVAAVTLAAGVLAGLMPAVVETRRLQTNPLRAMAGAERARQRWRDALVVIEVAITVALLVETASMVEAYGRAMTADLGFTTRPFIGVSLLHRDGIPVEDVLNVVRRVPGVSSAEVASDIPYIGLGTRIRVSTAPDSSNTEGAVRISVGPSFFSTLGVPIRSGRAFSAVDTPQARVAIVNQLLDSRLFPPNQEGSRQIWIDGVAYDVVGTVANYSSNPLRPEWTEPKVFLPLPVTRAGLTAANLLVRTFDDPGPAVQTVRREIRRVVPGIDVRRAHALSASRDVMAHEMVLGTAPLFPLVLIGMLLTAAGIYGVLAFAVTRRARELAVRVAVGATPRDVARIVTGHTSRLVAIGTILGVGITFGLSRLVRASGGAGSILDPALMAFVVPVVLLAAVAALASWLPARRALRMNPAVVLRTT